MIRKQHETGDPAGRRKAEAAAREVRLAEALRANLARRKGQDRARAATDPDGDQTGAET